ncbi:MAG TPA: hypoxanthine/guanine phosphoribosyltransferase [Methanomicrobiales archaeon]|jgi:adenine phosphoribosyltransferase|nr:hypoxanthine/guanine phosphoribosyltransferase [Methanomicrobiales archaeon]
MLERLIESLETCPIVKRGDYDYFIHPITDGVPQVDPALLRDVCTAMVKVLDLKDVKLFVVAEAMGIHIGTTLSLMTDIPFTVVRKRRYELPGEVAVHQTTGYSKGELYLNGVRRGDRVAIVDDVLSTGGTMLALIQALEHVGAEIADICVAIRRGKADVGRPVKSLVDIEVARGKVRIVGRSL